MPKDRYLNADHELIGKLLEQVSDLDKDEDKIHDVLCAVCMRNFGSPANQSACNALNKSMKGRSADSQNAKTVFKYLSYEIEGAEFDFEYFQGIHNQCYEALIYPDKATKLFKKKEFNVDNINIKFSNNYYTEEQLGLEQNNQNLYNEIKLAPQGVQKTSRANIKRPKIKPENNFINSKIRDTGFTFGDHFKGHTIEEILSKDLSRNIIARIFRSDSDQMAKVFKAAKEINNQNSNLDDSEKAVNLKNALDEYLIYKRPSIEKQLNSCQNNDERRELIDKNNIDFRRYEFCGKLAQHLAENSTEYGFYRYEHHLNYDQYKAYENANDAILNGIERIEVERRPSFSFSEFFRERIVEPISDFFRSIFSRSDRSNTNVDANTNNDAEESYDPETDEHVANESDYMGEIHTTVTNKETIRENQQETKKQVVDFSKPRIQDPFTASDKKMLQDLFNHSSGDAKTKLTEIALLSRVGLIKFHQSDALAQCGISGPFNPRFTTLGQTQRYYRDFELAVAKVVGAKESDVMSADDESFQLAYGDLCNRTTTVPSENRESLCKSYLNKDGMFQTNILENATKYNEELRQTFDQVSNPNKQQIDVNEANNLPQGNNNVIVNEEESSNYIAEDYTLNN